MLIFEPSMFIRRGEGDDDNEDDDDDYVVHVDEVMPIRITRSRTQRITKITATRTRTATRTKAMTATRTMTWRRRRRRHDVDEGDAMTTTMTLKADHGDNADNDDDEDDGLEAGDDWGEDDNDNAADDDDEDSTDETNGESLQLKMKTEKRNLNAQCKCTKIGRWTDCEPRDKTQDGQGERNNGLVPNQGRTRDGSRMGMESEAIHPSTKNPSQPME